ncbi:Hypothetical predicted protein [Podarcis lilfordi]|uniref:Uncharacterized protein n=1 Tax=Podarcis lilfordi TaxID=74358 RepID=A0AA35PUJ3_9SAUR|nr:Hypothetical predicted protein [Podarcis lilfordi]
MQPLPQQQALLEVRPQLGARTGPGSGGSGSWDRSSGLSTRPGGEKPRCGESGERGALSGPGFVPAPRSQALGELLSRLIDGCSLRRLVRSNAHGVMGGGGGRGETELLGPAPDSS